MSFPIGVSTVNGLLEKQLQHFSSAAISKCQVFNTSLFSGKTLALKEIVTDGTISAKASHKRRSEGKKTLKRKLLLYIK